MNGVGVVVIGRNEGDRLIHCLKILKTVLPDETPVVYVDSGSTDDSVAMAQSFDISVVELDLAQPFTAARGRNAGWQFLLSRDPNLRAVQFLDGDCELVPGWLERAIATLEQNPTLAAVTGRRRERFPEASIYNRLQEIEWNTPVGEVKEFWGDALVRVAALQQVEGFSASLICGEEPELCIRLRQQGWTIQRLDADMTIHDIAMTHFSQWWQRAIRGGWAVAEGKALHGTSPESYMVRQSLSGWLWGLLLPMLIMGLIWFTRGLSLLLLIAYGILIWRVYRYHCQRGDRPADAWLYACFCVLSKLPQAMGQAKYWLTRWQGKTATLIEYKAVKQT